MLLYEINCIGSPTVSTSGSSSSLLLCELSFVITGKSSSINDCVYRAVQNLDGGNIDTFDKFVVFQNCMIQKFLQEHLRLIQFVKVYLSKLFYDITFSTYLNL